MSLGPRSQCAMKGSILFYVELYCICIFTGEFTSVLIFLLIFLYIVLLLTDHDITTKMQYCTLLSCSKEVRNYRNHQIISKNKVLNLELLVDNSSTMQEEYIAEQDQTHWSFQVCLQPPPTTSRNRKLDGK